MIKLRIELSKHAKQRMVERDMKFEYVQETIEFPDYTIKNNGKKIREKKEISFSQIRLYQR